MQSAAIAALFSIFLCFHLLSFPYYLSQFFPSFASVSPEPHLDLKSSISNDWRGSLPQLRGDADWEEQIIDGLLFLHLHFVAHGSNDERQWRLIWEAGFPLFQQLCPQHVPVASVWSEYLFANPHPAVWHHGRNSKGCGGLAWRANLFTWKSSDHLCFSYPANSLVQTLPINMMMWILSLFFWFFFNQTLYQVFCPSMSSH